MFCFRTTWIYSKTLQRCPRTRPRTKKQGTKSVLEWLIFLKNASKVKLSCGFYLDIFMKIVLIHRWVKIPTFCFHVCSWTIRSFFHKGAFTYVVRCFGDPNQILYYISLFSKIRWGLTYLPTQKSDVIYECSLTETFYMDRQLSRQK